MGRLIGPKTWDRSVRFLGADLGNLDTVTDCYGPFVIIYSINSDLVFIRPEMRMEIGSTKRNRRRKCGLPVDSPLPLFWDCKNSPGFV